MRFRTNAKCSGCVGALAHKLNKVVPQENWYVDLNHPDRVLEVTTDLSPETILAVVEEAGLKAWPLP